MLRDVYKGQRRHESSIQFATKFLIGLDSLDSLKARRHSGIALVRTVTAVPSYWLVEVILVVRPSLRPSAVVVRSFDVFGVVG